MKALNFSGGVMMALVLSASGAVLLSGATLLTGFGIALRAVLLLVMLTYWLWLLRVTSARAGISLMAAGWLLLGVTLVAFNPPFVVWLATCTGWLWLQRSILRYRRPGPALADAGLSLLALCAAIVAYWHSGSFLLACWSFFLLQAACVFIPAQATPVTSTDATDANRFAQARHSAEQALRRLRQSESI